MDLHVLHSGSPWIDDHDHDHEDDHEHDHDHDHNLDHHDHHLFEKRLTPAFFNDDNICFLSPLFAADKLHHLQDKSNVCVFV